MEIPFQLVAGHLVCELDGQRVLVDTGSPFTIARTRVVRVLGALTDVTPPGPLPALDAIVAEIRALPVVPADFDVDLLLGCDVLAGCRLDLDWERSTLTLEAAPAGTLLPTTDDALLRLPRVQVEVNGHAFRGFADTGARLSYALPELLRGCPSGASARDFLMGLGTFDAPRVRASVVLAGEAFDAPVALAGTEVEPLLRATKVEGIVGTDLMARTRRTRIWFGRPTDQPDDVAAPDHPHVLPLAMHDGAIVVHADGSSNLYVPRFGEMDEMPETMLRLGVLAMVIGDGELYGELLRRFLSRRGEQ